MWGGEIKRVSAADDGVRDNKNRNEVGCKIVTRVRKILRRDRIVPAVTRRRFFFLSQPFCLLPLCKKEKKKPSEKRIFPLDGRERARYYFCCTKTVGFTSDAEPLGATARRGAGCLGLDNTSGVPNARQIPRSLR